MRVQCLYPRFVFCPPVLPLSILSFFTRRTGRLFGLAAVAKFNLFEALAMFNPFGEVRWGNQSVDKNKKKEKKGGCYLKTYICSFGEEKLQESAKVKPIYPTKRKLSIKGKQTWGHKRLTPPNAQSVSPGNLASVNQTESTHTHTQL